MTVLTFSSIKSTSINENRNQTSKSDSYFYLLFLSGETGIRTLGTVTRSPHFECGPIDHSGISPKRLKRLLKIQKALYRAERQGFEPRVPRGTTVFKTAAIDHSVQRFSRPPQSTTLPPLQTSLSSAFVFQKRCKGTHYF